MALPKIVYNPGTGNVTLTCVRGPQGFRAYTRSRVHDNVATSGYRERVIERRDMFLACEMPAMQLGGDLPEWAAFASWALGGGVSAFYPDAGKADYYNCVWEGDGFDPVRVGPQRYSAAFTFRIVPDAQAPGNPTVVVTKLHGL